MQEILTSWPKEREKLYSSVTTGSGPGCSRVFLSATGLPRLNPWPELDAWSMRIDPSLPRYHLE